MPGIGKEEKIWGIVAKEIYWGDRQNIIWGIGAVDAKMQRVCQRRGKERLQEGRDS